MEFNDRQTKALNKFLDVLPHGGDLDLVILKAHLLIEEQINLIIDRHTKNPQALKAAQFIVGKLGQQGLNGYFTMDDVLG